MVAMLGCGVYTFAEAAKLTGLSQNRIWEWFRGRGHHHSATRKPVFHGDYAPVGRDYALSFLDLVECYVAGQLREHGISLPTLRTVHHRLNADLKTVHAFARRELLSDGKQIFLRAMDEEGRTELQEILTRQKTFPRVLLPFLRKIDYDQLNLLAQRWHLTEEVVLDPAICFGKPIVQAVGKPTAVLAAAWKANKEDAELVADWYGVKVDHVLAAVRFEDLKAE